MRKFTMVYEGTVSFEAIDEEDAHDIFDRLATRLEAISPVFGVKIDVYSKELEEN